MKKYVINGLTFEVHHKTKYRSEAVHEAEVLREKGFMARFRRNGSFRGQQYWTVLKGPMVIRR